MKVKSKGAKKRKGKHLSTKVRGYNSGKNVDTKGREKFKHRAKGSETGEGVDRWNNLNSVCNI